MNSKVDRKRLTIELLAVTSEALEAARIDYQERYLELMSKRERILCQLCGFNPDSSLPVYSASLAKEKRVNLNNINPEVMIKVREMDASILKILKAKQARIRSKEKQLECGHSYLKGMRNLTDSRQGNRLDCRG